MSEPQPPDDAKPIQVNGRTIDPQEHYAKDAKNTNHIIVTTRAILTHSQRTELKGFGIHFLEDLGNNTLLCRYKPADLEPLRHLAYVQQVDVYRNVFKIPEALRDFVQRQEKDSDETRDPVGTFDVMVHSDVSDVSSLADSISTKLGIEKKRLDIFGTTIRLQTAVKNLDSIASDDRVRIIEYVVAPTLDDLEATHIVRAPVKSSITSSIFTGQDQVIAVVDSGFDTGSAKDCHPAFVGKIAGLISAGRAMATSLSDERKVDDPIGHGTHVCGTIIAQEINTGAGPVGGVAPDAKLVVTSLVTEDNRSLVRITNTTALFSKPYDEFQARTFSNSWGDGLLIGNKQASYTTSAGEIDEWIRSKIDAIVCFSAGNNNLDISNATKQAIGSQAAAKNVITVGASGSTRVETDIFSHQPVDIEPDKMSDESSRGPTTNNRIKPDVVAPGVNIYSAHSRNPFVTYKAAQTSSSPESSYPGILWKVRTGTSHATPLVAGCAAILRQIAQAGGCAKPPSALIKALIINGADELPDVDFAAQGFGRVNLEASAKMLQSPVVIGEKQELEFSPSAAAGVLIGPALLQDEEFSFTLLPLLSSTSGTTDPASQAQLKVTMVYNDLRGTQIQNNLNLSVINPETDEIKHGGLSEDDIDLQNNVEQVAWNPAPQVPVTVRVRAQKIFPDSQQDFVLAWLVSEPYKGYGL